MDFWYYRYYSDTVTWSQVSGPFKKLEAHSLHYNIRNMKFVLVYHLKWRVRGSSFRISPTFLTSLNFPSNHPQFLTKTLKRIINVTAQVQLQLLLLFLPLWSSTQLLLLPIHSPRVLPSLLWWIIISTQSPTSLCINPSPPWASRSDSVSNLSQCCVQVERRTASTASSLFRSLSTAHICIDLSCFWAGGTGGSDTRRLIPIDLHRAFRGHSSFIW